MGPREIEESVRAVIAAVRERGDAALCDFTERWDRVRLEPAALRVPEEAIAAVPLDAPFGAALERAAERIRRFHEEVKPRSVTFEDGAGARLGMRWTPLDSVGLYVPGGKASYPSTLLMTAIPARIAGVRRIAVVSPPGPGGEVSPEVLLAARILSLREVYRAGGAQAIAALALGTASIPRVDKVFGPGNAFVAEAKKQLYGEVGIDLLAGPSELVVYADHTAEPEWAAADLMAQAEHDEATRVTLLASSPQVLAAVRRAMDRLVEAEPRRETIRRSWERNGTFEVAASHDAAAERIDRIAPEHLSLQVADPHAVLRLVRNAGAIFLGRWSPVAVGDYYAGPNHVLPTGRAARFASCLSVEDFMKRSNVVELDEGFLRSKGEDVEILARGERLPAHATSVALRRRDVPGGASRARRGLRSVTPYPLVEEEAEVKLNQNESPWDVPAEVKDEVARRLRDLPWNRYHQRIPQELLARIARDEGLGEDQVIAASGSNLLLQWVFEAFLEPGATLLCPAPSFSLYPLWGEVCEARLAPVPLSGPSFEYDTARFEEAIERLRPAVTVLCLPNNPTGSELEPDGVRRVARAAERAGGIVVIDEAYREFTEPELDRSFALRELENVVLVRTCSKAFSAAGMRLGYLLAPRAIAAELRKLVPPFHVSLFAAVFGKVLWERKGLFLERVKALLAERDRLMAALAKVRGVEVLPTHANFFLVRVGDAARLFQGLVERGILVRAPGKDPALAGCLRVNAGTREEGDRLIAAVKSILEGGR
ncbi:MAG: histidinol dehydrogenase [Planctomycetes bacterium]|nr:histidinol dehydrogenase [Planctomycetota bacterium]